MTGEGWEILLRKGCVRLAGVLPDDQAEGLVLARVQQGQDEAWCMLRVDEQAGEVTELTEPMSGAGMAWMLWNVWSQAKGLRESAGMN